MVPQWRPRVHVKTYCAHSLSHLVWIRLAVGATVGAVLTPVLAPAGLGVIGFSPAGPVAGEFPTRPASRASIPLLIRENWNI